MSLKKGLIKMYLPCLLTRMAVSIFHLTSILNDCRWSCISCLPRVLSRTAAITPTVWTRQTHTITIKITITTITTITIITTTIRREVMHTVGEGAHISAQPLWVLHLVTMTWLMTTRSSQIQRVRMSGETARKWLGYDTQPCQVMCMLPQSETV